jgi:hypothetical protein
MLKALIVLSLISLPALSQAAEPADPVERVQFKIELSLNGCEVTKQRSNCDGSKETTSDYFVLPLECASMHNGACELQVGRATKDYVLHWSERNETRKVKIAVTVSRQPKTTAGVPLYNFDLHAYPENMQDENDDRSVSFSTQNLNTMFLTSLTGKTEMRPGSKSKTITLWHSVTASEFLVTK